MTMARLMSEGRSGWAVGVRVLGSWTARLRGLLGTGPEACPVMLTRCGSVHTFGMTYPIDLLFVGEEGEVLKSCRNVVPREFRSCAGAFCVIERPSREDEWPEAGERLWVCAISADALRP